MLDHMASDQIAVEHCCPYWIVVGSRMPRRQTQGGLPRPALRPHDLRPWQ